FWGSICRFDELGHSEIDVMDSRDTLRFHKEREGSSPYVVWHTTTYRYNRLGLPEYVEDPMGNVSRAWYDSLDRMHTFQDPDRGMVFFGYDDTGNLINQIDALGQVTEITYDPLSRLKT